MIAQTTEPARADAQQGPIVEAVVVAYLHHVQVSATFTVDSLDERRRTLSEFAEQFGSVPVAACRAFHLSDWIESHRSWRSSSTRKAKANQVNACFNWASKQGRIDRNPFSGVTYAEADPRPPMEDGSLDLIMSRASKPFERAVRFLRLTGCRLGELCGLTWQDVDLSRGLVTLQKHKSRRKTGKAKMFVLVPAAVELLLAIKRELLGDCLAIGPVFTNNRGTPWNRRTLGQTLKRMKARGLVATTATLHGIRHQFGTTAIANGAPLKLVSEQLGHSSTAITERYYCHLSADHAEAIRAAAMQALPR